MLKETRHYFVIAKTSLITVHSLLRQLLDGSDLRMWLNDDSANGFLFVLQREEKERIEPVVRKTLLSPAFKDQ